MRGKVLAVVGLGAAALLGACGKPSSGGSDQPAQPTEPASAPAQLTDAQKKALLAELPAAYQTADVDNGQARFALCKSCHTTAQGGSDMTGPNLFGVFGRKAGTKAGFSFSDPMKASGVTWDAATLDTWIAKPGAMIAGTRMTYIGMADAKDRADVIAYLKVATSPAPAAPRRAAEMTFSIRLAKASDVPWLPDVERSAAETFLTITELAWVVTDGVTDDATHARLIAAGAEWVADDQVGEPVGFLAGERFGCDLHIWELAVSAAFQRHGLGRRLIAAAEAQAQAEGLTGVTLTTFRHVAWNGPFYERLGFEILDESALPAHLAEALKNERERKLPDRVAMRKRL